MSAAHFLRWPDGCAAQVERGCRHRSFFARTLTLAFTDTLFNCVCACMCTNRLHPTAKMYHTLGVRHPHRACAFAVRRTHTHACTRKHTHTCTYTRIRTHMHAHACAHTLSTSFRSSLSLSLVRSRARALSLFLTPPLPPPPFSLALSLSFSFSLTLSLALALALSLSLSLNHSHPPSLLPCLSTPSLSLSCARSLNHTSRSLAHIQQHSSLSVLATSIMHPTSPWTVQHHDPALRLSLSLSLSVSFPPPPPHPLCLSRALFLNYTS